MAGSEHELKKKLKLTEEMVTEVTLSELEKNPEGITKYPILEFDERALRLLSAGVAETLQYSHVKPAGGRAYCAVKRLIDIVVSFLALVLFAVPMGVVALVIFAQDGGNPIFSQERLTENGKMFRMYKFRSMCQDAEEKFAEVQKENQTDGLAFKSDSDPRITKFARPPSMSFPSSGTCCGDRCPSSAPVRPCPGKWFYIRPTRWNACLSRADFPVSVRWRDAAIWDSMRGWNPISVTFRREICGWTSS